MSNEVTLGKFAIGHQRGVLSVRRVDEGESLKFMPAEAATIKELVGIALGMEELPALPKKIENNVFRLNFHSDDTLSLTATDGRKGEIPFTWREGDSFIKVVEEAFKLGMNDRILNVGGVKNGPSFVDSNLTEPFSL